MTCTSSTDVIIDGDYKFITNTKTALLSYPATDKLIIKCWQLKGLEDCSGTARVFACLDTGFCEPIYLQIQDGWEEVTLYSVERQPVNWTLTLDNSLLDSSCFPRRVAATSVYWIETDDSSPEIIFPLLLVFVSILLVFLCIFSVRRFSKFVAPRVVTYYREEQATIHDRRDQPQLPPQFNSPAVPESLNSPPKGGEYAYMV
eukprot:TRINITY_DN16664_c0_g1_i1.p1 TRINITY_DN16664_c0_g1~~TRINITY_DN16664_c0_g1_i1.p1  ORF type:complete len:202 (+),score=26.12 TRINITY_DN16664_c0_g1_i1:24-629(+)